MGQGDPSGQHQGGMMAMIARPDTTGFVRRYPAEYQPLPKKVPDAVQDGRRPIEGRLLVRTMDYPTGSFRSLPAKWSPTNELASSRSPGAFYRRRRGILGGLFRALRRKYATIDRDPFATPFPPAWGKLGLRLRLFLAFVGHITLSAVALCLGQEDSCP
jgi:hypothetical protein